MPWEKKECLIMAQQTESGSIENMAEMDKVIEEFLMPPPDATPKSFVLRNSVDSLKDASSSSLDRSNNSCSTTTSWNSSCSCHSMASLSNSGNKSTFIFHKQAILPPLLCSSSRTEMKVYKIKAVEKEQKRHEKEKQRLISRVEAILSSVEISPVRTRQHRQTDEKIEEDSGLKKHLHDISSSQTSNDATEAHDAVESQDDGNGDEASHHDDCDRHSDHNDVTNSGSDANDKPLQDEVHGHLSSDESSDDIASFHDNAYKSSLRNLLQKSLSFNQTGNAAANKSPSKEDSQQSKSTSESDEDITGNTVIDVAPDLSPHETPEPPKTDGEQPKIEESDSFSEEDTLVENIVDSVIDEAKREISNQNNPQSSFLHHNVPPCDETNTPPEMAPHQNALEETTCPKDPNPVEVSSWETPKILKVVTNEEIPGGVGRAEERQASPCSVTNSQFFELHNQSTSTKLDSPLGLSKERNWEEKALEQFTNLENFNQLPMTHQSASPLEGGGEPEEESLRTNSIGDEKNSVNSQQVVTSVIELPGTLCFESTVNEACPADSRVSIATSKGDLTVLKPVMSDTISDVTSMTSSEDNMKENCDPAIEQGPLTTLKRSLSFTLDRPSTTFESAVIDAVTQHFHGNQDKKQVDGTISPDPGNDRDAVKEKKLLRARVRRGSYTLDEPSPYLVKNKESLDIEFRALDDDVCSETTYETGPHDVKRKLDLMSDSEESSLPTSVKKHGLNDKAKPSKAELNVVNLCKILEDQHAQQMELMKQRHQQQLESLQKELVHSENKMTLPLDGAAQGVLVPPSSHDLTVSPSLASTEYKDICLRRPRSIDPVHYHVNQERRLASVSSYLEESDISRITDVELTLNLHEKLCKLSALCKGHLTRKLLGSNKVQEILQIIRDTSRLILSLRLEGNESQGMDSVTDANLEDRLYTQLRSAMHHLHHIFFGITMRERMSIIAQSSILEKMTQNVPKSHKPQKLSTATQKFLERKRLMSATSPPQAAPSHGRPTHKEVKSKISHIWKADMMKAPEKKSPPVKLPSSATNPAKRPSNKPLVTSQTKSKSSPVTSQTRSVSAAKSTTTSQKLVKKSPMTSEHHPVTSQQRRLEEKKRGMMSQSRKPVSNPKTNSVKSASVSSLKSQSSNNASVKGKSVTSRSSTKSSAQGSKVTQSKAARGRKPAPLSNANQTNILPK